MKKLIHEVEDIVLHPAIEYFISWARSQCVQYKNEILDPLVASMNSNFDATLFQLPLVVDDKLDTEFTVRTYFRRGFLVMVEKLLISFFTGTTEYSIRDNNIRKEIVSKICSFYTDNAKKVINALSTVIQDEVMARVNQLQGSLNEESLRLQQLLNEQESLQVKHQQLSLLVPDALNLMQLVEQSARIQHQLHDYVQPSTDPLPAVEGSPYWSRPSSSLRSNIGSSSLKQPTTHPSAFSRSKAHSSEPLRSSKEKEKEREYEVETAATTTPTTTSTHGSITRQKPSTLTQTRTRPQSLIIPTQSQKKDVSTTGNKPQWDGKMRQRITPISQRTRQTAQPAGMATASQVQNQPEPRPSSLTSMTTTPPQTTSLALPLQQPLPEQHTIRAMETTKDKPPIQNILFSVRALQAYTGKSTDELSVYKGAVIKVLQENEKDDLFYGILDGKVGW